MKILNALNLLNRILCELFSNINTGMTKWFCNFMKSLFDAAVSIPGKINFTQLARYSGLSERTFRNWFSRDNFNWVRFNQNSIHMAFHQGDTLAVAFDPAYIPKSGNMTYGVGRYWSGVEKRSKWGLEIMALGVLDVEKHSMMMLEAIQTPTVEELHESKGMTMLEWYAHLLISRAEDFKQVSDIIVGDAFFSRKPFIDKMIEQGFRYVGRLLPKQRLRYLASKEDQDTYTHKRGRKFTYAGKVFPDRPETDRMHSLNVDGARWAYWAILNCEVMKRDIKVVIVNYRSTGIVMYFSTDLDMEANMIINIYQGRFQIEFGIRDSKQYTGLTDSQARSKEKLNFAFNFSFATRNLLGLLAIFHYPDMSIGKIKAILSNVYLANRIRATFGKYPNKRAIRNIEMLIAELAGVRA